MTERMILSIPELFADLVEPYLAQRREDVPTWKTMLQDGRFDDLRRAAHKVRGSGGSFGVQPLSELAAALEQAAVEQDVAACERLIADIATLLDRLELRFE